MTSLQTPRSWSLQIGKISAEERVQSVDITPHIIFPPSCVSPVVISLHFCVAICAATRVQVKVLAEVAAAQPPAPAVEEPQATPGTSTPAQNGPQVSPLCQDVSWTELERFLYEPTIEELQQKILAQPVEARQRMAQALLASLGPAGVSHPPVHGSPSSSSGASSSSGVSSATFSSSRPDAPQQEVGTQTDGYVLLVHGSEAIHVNLHVRGTVDPR